MVKQVLKRAKAATKAALQAAAGVEVKPSRRAVAELDTGGLDRVHYASGDKIKQGWLNVDLLPVETILESGLDTREYRFVNLLAPHPFKDESFAFGYSEDFLEHLEQDEALTFLYEAHRTLKKDGVLRLSTPSLEGVLRRHYRGQGFGAAAMGEHEAYRMWGHLHFFCRDEIALIARHIGFRNVEFCEYGQSSHAPLRNLDTRNHQQDLNLIVELTR
ncbi:MAG: methyltransferase domain-containing protein [Phycisphaerales bacterium]|nr:methyltransferase domain-containing protein [Phycisphaerales bacterium]